MIEEQLQQCHMAQANPRWLADLQDSLQRTQPTFTWSWKGALLNFCLGLYLLLWSLSGPTGVSPNTNIPDPQLFADIYTEQQLRCHLNVLVHENIAKERPSYEN